MMPAEVALAGGSRDPLGHKVAAGHLSRNAYVYVRQSTPRQVLENTESTRRQYDLRARAVALGWPRERVIVIDKDQGCSGAASADRVGFQQLAAEIGLGHAGIVLGLEVSRLARNSSDWHRLLEFCALTDTLLCDEDGVYDPSDFNDRLLLGLKGTMSEAELHLLKARLRGGILNRARRGELRLPLPAGLAYAAGGEVVLDPDQRVREALRHLFATFERTGSATGTVKHFRKQGLLFPVLQRGGPCKGRMLWKQLTHDSVLRVLRNPRYAGAFAFGRTRVRHLPDGRKVVRSVPREEWLVLLPGAHPGYVSWERFEANERRLAENARAYGPRFAGPPREGPALLQGMALCGRCGQRMTIRYSQRGRRPPAGVHVPARGTRGRLQRSLPDHPRSRRRPGGRDAAGGDGDAGRAGSRSAGASRVGGTPRRGRRLARPRRAAQARTGRDSQAVPAARQPAAQRGDRGTDDASQPSAAGLARGAGAPGSVPRARVGTARRGRTCAHPGAGK